MCEGDILTISLNGTDIPAGSTVDFYIGSGTFNPYNGEGDFIGSIPTPAFPDFSWTIPSGFCETYGEGDWSLVGILDPPPAGACMQIFTSNADLPVSCPELSLSGGGDICEGNCPDNPNSITFFVTGNDLPFEADIEVTASVFPPFAINDLEITNGQQLFICLGGILPSFDPATNTLTIPSFAVGLSATVEIISLVSASGCPVLMPTSTVTLNFIPSATANAGPDQTICSFEQAMLNGNLGGSAVTALWSTSGDGMFTDPSSLTATYVPGASDIATGSVTLTLTGTDANGACFPAQSSMLLTIEPSIMIDVGLPLTICNTDVANISAVFSGPAVPGVWESDGDGTFEDPNAPSTVYEPGNNDLNTGSVTLYFNPVDPDICVSGNEPLEITIVNAPIVNVPDDIEVCSDDSITIHINVNGNFTSITWTTSGDGVLLLITDTEVNYTPGPQDIDDQFTIVSVTVVSAYPQCGQTTYNLPINIIDCNCPGFQTIPPLLPLCSENSMLDLSTLLQAGGSGMWSITNAPSGSNPAVIAGNNFIANLSDPGIYEVTYTLSFPEPGCPATSSENIIVSPLLIPDAGANIANCGPSMVFVSGAVNPPGAADITWETLGDGSFVSETSMATSYIPGPLDSIATSITIVLHVFDPVCGNKTDTTQILFPVPPFVSFANDTIVICNEEDKGSVVDFFALITGGDTSGTWTNISGAPVDFSNPENVNFDGIAPGYYIFNYHTEAAMFPCQNVDSLIVIKVESCLCPILELQNLPEGICNSQPDLNLSAFIMAGGPGSWEIISSPMGVNPATLAGPVLQTLNADPGIYRLRFTFDSAPLIGCPDSAELDIRLQTPPFISVADDTSSCGLLPVQLIASLSGSATQVEWTTSGLGNFNDPFSPAATYSPSIEDLNSTSVWLYVTGIDTSGICANVLDSVQLLMVHPPSTSWSSLSTSICNNADSVTIVNLTSFITEGDGTGIWSDLNAAGVILSDPASVDFNGVVPGTYVFSYLTQTAVTPCTDSMYLFTVLVEDCACPPFLIGTLNDTFCIPASIDLSALIIDAAPGNWSITNGPPGGNWPIINMPNVITANAGEGDYQLSYKLIDSIPGCPATQVVPFSLESLPVVQFGNTICNDADMTYSVELSSNAFVLSPDIGIISEITPGNYLIESVPAGQNIIVETGSLSGSCTDQVTFTAPNCGCTLQTEDINDTILICPGDTMVLIPFVTGAQGLVFNTWVSDITLMRPSLPLYEEKTWIWIARDSAGCEQRDTFHVALRELITIDAISLPPTCKGLDDGSIVIEEIDGGDGPYTIQLDDMPPFLVNVLPDTISMVGVGLHKLTVRNADDCQTIINVQVNNVSPGSLDLGPDVSVPFGDSVFIQPQFSNIKIFSFEWDPFGLSDDVGSFWYIPEASHVIRLTVTDSLGCIYEDEMLITIEYEQHIFIPNIFTPNGDQINDVLEVFTSSLSNPIETVEIFDRWGNMLHRVAGSGPFAWDGSSRGKEVPPGVYVVKVIWKDNDGNSHMIVGDVTLIK